MTVVTFCIRPLGHDLGCTQSLVKNGTPAAFQKPTFSHRLSSIFVEDSESTMPAREFPNSGTQKHHFWHALTQVIAFLKPVVSRGESFKN